MFILSFLFYIDQQAFQISYLEIIIFIYYVPLNHMINAEQFMAFATAQSVIFIIVIKILFIDLLNANLYLFYFNCYHKSFLDS